MNSVVLEKIDRLDSALYLPALSNKKNSHLEWSGCEFKILAIHWLQLLYGAN